LFFIVLGHPSGRDVERLDGGRGTGCALHETTAKKAWLSLCQVTHGSHPIVGHGVEVKLEFRSRHDLLGEVRVHRLELPMRTRHLLEDRDNLLVETAEGLLAQSGQGAGQFLRADEAEGNEVAAEGSYGRRGRLLFTVNRDDDLPAL